MPTYKDQASVVLEYPNVSAGYIGTETGTATTGARYYAELAKSGWQVDRHKRQIFPQRVPVLSFFDELLYVENESFRRGLHGVRQIITDQLELALSLKSENSDYFCNSLDLAARFGLFEPILRIADNADDSLRPIERFKIETYAIMMGRELGAPRGVELLVHLAKQVADPLLSALIWSRVIVENKRHRESGKLDTANIAGEILNQIKRADVETEIEFVWLSMIYRALPMASGIDAPVAKEMLALSVSYANQLPVSSALTALAKKDLLYTTYQSSAKFSLSQNDEEQAESLVSEMIKLDPFDSVGFSEMGLLQMKTGRFGEAKKNFISATELGPPALGLNLYLLGKTYSELNDVNLAEKAFRKGMDVDPSGLSHYLELIEILKRSGRSAEMRLLIGRILADSDLREQLTTDELKGLRND